MTRLMIRSRSTAPYADKSLLMSAGPAFLRWNVTTYVTIWIVLLFGISARQVIGPFGAIGTPALIVAMGGLVLWVGNRVVSPPDVPAAITPLKIALLTYLWYLGATIVIANTRSLTPLEQSASAREAITLLALSGMALLVMDGVASYDRLEDLLRRLVWGATFLAGMGIVQFLFGTSLVLDVPGLSFNQSVAVVNTRSLFNRPFGTALHPIEFSVVLAALLPLALHFALEGDEGTSRRRNAITAAVLIGLGVPLSISRSGIVALVGAMGIMALGWTWRRRAQGLLTAVIALPVLWLVVPGLLGTLRGMFTSFESDPSVQARLARVPKILDLIREYPWFGRGAGTYSVDDYFLIDNEFWVSTIEIGVIGICLTIGLLLLAVVMAITSRHHAFATARTSHLGYALAAGVTGIVVSIVTFDAFFYHILRGTLFLLLGAIGALWRLTREDAVAS